MEIRELEWDDDNEEHVTQRGLNPERVEQVVAEAPLVLRNKGGRRGRIKVVGPDYGGAPWTVILAATDRRGVWRPVTGWRATTGEQTQYDTAKRRS